jgi:spore maturation protein CgeB
MINKTILLLTPYKDLSKHRFSKWIPYLNSIRLVNFEDSFLKPLKSIFSKVILYDYVDKIVQEGVQKTNEDLIELVEKEKPYYLLWIAFGEYYEIQENTFEIIRKKGTKIIGWFFDDDIRFDYYSKWWIPYIDFVITSDINNGVEKYQKLGITSFFAVPDVWDAVERDWLKKPEKYDVSFVGTIYLDREQYLTELEKAGIKVKIFGIGTQRYLSFQEIKNIFWESKINLNFSKTPNNQKLTIKGRIFNVPLSGGFLLTEYFPGLEKFFEINKEVVCFKNKEELLEKVKYYLFQEKERKKIAQAGWKRAINEYDSYHILLKIFERIEKISARHFLDKPPIPDQVKKRISIFYFNWGKAYLFENYNNLWKECLLLALKYDPTNFKAKIFFKIGKFPLPFRFLWIFPNWLFCNFYWTLKSFFKTIFLIIRAERLFRKYYKFRNFLRLKIFQR